MHPPYERSVAIEHQVPAPQHRPGVRWCGALPRRAVPATVPCGVSKPGREQTQNERRPHHQPATAPASRPPVRRHPHAAPAKAFMTRVSLALNRSRCAPAHRATQHSGRRPSRGFDGGAGQGFPRSVGCGCVIVWVVFSHRSTPVLRHSVRGAVALAVAGFVLCAATGAFADDATIQAVLNPDGSGLLIANGSTNPSRTWSWDICAPDGIACKPFASGQHITTAGAPADVVFEAIASDGPTAMSPVWSGRVSPLTPPTVTGTIQANAFVTPVAGTWNGGGWPGDSDWFQLAACQNADGSDCTTLTDWPYYAGACPNGAAVIDPAFTGDYLRVADQVLPADTARDLHLALTPYLPGEWTAGPTISVAVVGQIAAATGPRQANCGPPPIGSSTAPPAAPQGPTGNTGSTGPATLPPSSPAATASKPDIATLSKTGLARVTCANTCTIELTASRGSHTVHERRALGATGKIALRIPKNKLRRLGHGRTTFTVTIDGSKTAARSIRLR